MRIRPRSPTCSLTYLLAHSLQTCFFTYLLAHSLTVLRRSLELLLACLFTYSLTYLLHSLTYSPPSLPRAPPLDHLRPLRLKRRPAARSRRCPRDEPVPALGQLPDGSGRRPGREPRQPQGHAAAACRRRMTPAPRAGNGGRPRGHTTASLPAQKLPPAICSCVSGIKGRGTACMPFEQSASPLSL